MKIETALIVLALALISVPLCLGATVVNLDDYIGRLPAICIATPICTVVGIMFVTFVGKSIAPK